MLPLCCLFTGTDGGIETDNILSFQWQLIVKSDGRDPVQQWSKKWASLFFCQLLTWCEHYNRKTHSRLSCWTRNSAFSVQETRSSASSGFPFWYTFTHISSITNSIFFRENSSYQPRVSSWGQCTKVMLELFDNKQLVMIVPSRKL